MKCTGTLLVLKEMLLLIFYIICSRKAPKPSVVGNFMLGDFTLSQVTIFELPLNKSVQPQSTSSSYPLSVTANYK